MLGERRVMIWFRLASSSTEVRRFSLLGEVRFEPPSNWYSLSTRVKNNSRWRTNVSEAGLERDWRLVLMLSRKTIKKKATELKLSGRKICSNGGDWFRKSPVGFVQPSKKWDYLGDSFASLTIEISNVMTARSYYDDFYKASKVRSVH